MLRVGYAYGEAWDVDDSVRLPRRPRHSGSLAVERRNEESGFGVELSWVADREDLDGAPPYGAIEGEDYLVVRVYGQTELGERASLYGRVRTLRRGICGGGRLPVWFGYTEVYAIPSRPCGRLGRVCRASLKP